MKIQLIRSTADGEQLSFEADVDNNIAPEALRDTFSSAFRLADDRMLEMNTRIFTTQAMARRLPPEFIPMWHSLVEIMHGQQPTDLAFREILKEVLQDVTEKVVEAGVKRTRVDQAIERSYGPHATRPKGTVIVNKEDGNGKQ